MNQKIPAIASSRLSAGLYTGIHSFIGPFAFDRLPSVGGIERRLFS
ncbi:MAG: hypothetical protein ACK5WB_04215 [Phycisphaerales bacterium]|jgi:hypothetical protein|nr:hypothetical protein [Phycisphaeraceae bacterium]